ncbi:MAG: ankyrin repeat domain-containing protein, partial [Bdellovibrio sp.]
LLFLLFFLSSCSSLDKQTKNFSLWAHSARVGDVQTLQDLANKQEQNYDKQDAHGVTALMIAARFGQTDMVRFLIGKGVNVNLEDQDKQTAVEYALLGPASPSKEAVVSLLVANGADVFKKSNLGITPVYEMVAEGYLEEIKFLKFSDKFLCDRIQYKNQEDSLVLLAKKNNHIELANYLESQGCH